MTERRPARRDPPPPDTGGIYRDGFEIYPEGWALLIVFCAVVAFVIYLFVGTPA
jgi:hypothetical protein